MQTIQIRRVSKLAAFLSLVTLLAVALPNGAQAKGGSGGGGSTPKVVEARVTGYVTSIDYAAGKIAIGASYYGSGWLTVTPDTKYSIGTSGGGFTDIKVGDWAEARYTFSNGELVATKISITAPGSL